MPVRRVTRGALTSSTRRLAGTLARSSAFARGRELWERNQQDFWRLPLSRSDKALVGLYLICADYERGLFPPRFDDERAAHANEMRVRETTAGMTEAEYRDAELRKPYWYWDGGSDAARLLPRAGQVVECLHALAVPRGARVLELGCGSGWLSEALAMMGFSVLGTTLAAKDVQDARLRVEAAGARGIDVDLAFEVAAMEDVAAVAGRGCFRVVVVFEALHHAYDWRRTLRSAFASLEPDGWLLVCGEPNLAHTAVSYRVGKLTSTHEVGLSRRALQRECLRTGFDRTRVLRNRVHLLVRDHWLAAHKPASARR